MIFFISAPAWQIFSLCILPLIVGSGLFALTASMTAFRFVLLFAIVVELLWIYSVSIYIKQKYSNQITVPLTTQQVSLIYLLIHAFIFSMDLIPNDQLFLFTTMGIVANIYCVYFVSRILVMAEKERRVSFHDYVGTFFLVYIFIYGIWWLQPRVNRLHKLNA